MARRQLNRHETASNEDRQFLTVAQSCRFVDCNIERTVKKFLESLCSVLYYACWMRLCQKFFPVRLRIEDTERFAGCGI
jgi:hypothetical protein